MKNYISLAALFGATAVILGAFGAHALKEKLTVNQLQIFETGVRYQFYHALALLALGLLTEKLNSPALNYSAYFFMAGIIMFSGSLYLLSTIDISGLSGIKSILGPVTPVGGLLLVCGWISLLFAIRSK
jgi:uncharacterized membrane protein YgdD (TMEM256/DUF423 family)